MYVCVAAGVIKRQYKGNNGAGKHLHNVAVRGTRTLRWKMTGPKQHKIAAIHLV